VALHIEGAADCARNAVGRLSAADRRVLPKCNRNGL